MNNPLPIPDDLGANVPPDARAAIAAVFLALQPRIGDLEVPGRDLEARLKLHSTRPTPPSRRRVIRSG